MSLVWAFLIFVVVLAVVGVILFFLFRSKKGLSSEVEELKGKLGDNPVRVINFCSGITQGHAELELAKVDGIGLGGNNRFYCFPRDVRLERNAFGGVANAGEFDRVFEFTHDPRRVFKFPRHSFSDYLDYVFILPSRFEDLPEGLRDLFAPFLRSMDILEPYVDAYREGKVSQDEIMKLLAGSSDLGSLFLDASFRLWDKINASPQPISRAASVKSEGGE